MKILVVHSSGSKLLSDEESESDEVLALMTRKIKKMIEKRNKFKRKKARPLVQEKSQGIQKMIHVLNVARKGTSKDIATD